jgi:diguanylate cyclase (GGDEF)-like protein
MSTIYYCIAYLHDLRLVALAALICAIASITAINLLRHASLAKGQMRFAWLGISAISTGFGIWATHFIAMLAFTPGIPSGYNIVLTAASLVAAILLTGAGLAIALIPHFRPGPAIGGAVVAGGIAAMHFTGMTAFEVPASLHWDQGLVIVSIVLGVAFGAVALPVGLHGRNESYQTGGALLLTLAICSHHFTAMSAVTLVPDPTIMVSSLSVPAGLLALAVAVASLAIIGLAAAGIVLDIHDRRRTDLEADRMRGLANAAIEGLILCDGDTIVTVNNSFAALAGAAAESFVGKSLGACFSGAPLQAGLIDKPDLAAEAKLHRQNGTDVPVELILRQIDFAGRPHKVVAVRDLHARKEAEQRIRFLSNHDALTGLPNRDQFNDRVDAAIANARPGRKHAMLYLNLDRFKEVNDLFGHATGDMMLQTIAASINALLKDGQMMARLIGDEFAILLPDLRNPAAAESLARRVLATLRARIDASELGCVSTSIGIALYPDDATDREALLTHANTALYRAKSDGGAIYRRYEVGMGDAVRDRRMLEHDLRNAVGSDQFKLVYQPQEGVQHGHVIGFEALLRWTHPARGAVSPALFIPVAEDNGTIVEIGEWVMRTACAEAARWRHPLTIAVNVSAVQIYHDDFVPMVHRILFETGLSPSRLEIEITETALVRDFNLALSALRRVKALGVRIAMDDFGTGYSSLSNLRAFPFDKIKIDGSFIKSVNSNGQAATIVRAVVGLGHGLGLPVLAEGVETAAELKFLQDEKCDEVQGYLLGRPAPVDHFAHLTGGGPAAADVDIRAA